MMKEKAILASLLKIDFDTLLVLICFFPVLWRTKIRNMSTCGTVHLSKVIKLSAGFFCFIFGVLDKLNRARASYFKVIRFTI